MLLYCLVHWYPSGHHSYIRSHYQQNAHFHTRLIIIRHSIFQLLVRHVNMNPNPNFWVDFKIHHVALERGRIQHKTLWKLRHETKTRMTEENTSNIIAPNHDPKNNLPQDGVQQLNPNGTPITHQVVVQNFSPEKIHWLRLKQRSYQWCHPSIWMPYYLRYLKI